MNQNRRVEVIPECGNNCPEGKQLQLFLDERLIPTQAAGIALHLEACQQCQSVCEALSQTHGLTPNSDAADDDAVLAGLMNRLLADVSLASHPEIQTTVDEPVRFPVPPDTDAPLGRLGMYRIHELVAEGAQGTLFRAIDDSLGRTVAIKVLHRRLAESSAALARFQREARLGASLRSEYVVRVLQVGQHPGFPPFVVMEFVNGETLRDLLARLGPLPIRDTVRIVRDIAQGLAAAHRAGLIHRDVKPSNILLDSSSGNAQLSDFGLAVESTNASRMTQTGVLIGTPAYMSPEQIRSPEIADPRSDIYALGVVLFELLTGAVPFRGIVRMMLLQILNDDPPLLRRFNDTIPRDLETLCLRCMSKDPATRLQTVESLIAELDRWSSGQPILSRPVTHSERFTRWCRRNPIVAGLSAAVFALMVTLTCVMTVSAWRLKQSSRRSDELAIAVTNQRNSALDTLGRLIFELQNGFDQQNVKTDELQRDSLKIALEGLRTIKSSAEQQSDAGLPMAEALRRLGRILFRLDQNDEAMDCLRQSEQILRGHLLRSPSDARVKTMLVETLWAIDDYELLADDPTSAKLREGVELTRELHRENPTFATTQMLAFGLFYEGTADMRQSRCENASARFVESRDLCEELLREQNDNDLNGANVWLRATNGLTDVLLIADDRDKAALQLQDAVRRSEQFVATHSDNATVAVQRLRLIERLLNVSDVLPGGLLPAI